MLSTLVLVVLFSVVVSGVVVPTSSVTSVVSVVMLSVSVVSVVTLLVLPF